MQHSLVRLDLQEIVCNVKSCCSLIISGNFFKVVEDTCLNTEIVEQCKFLLPLFGRADVGIQNNLMTFENTDSLTVEATVFPAGSESHIFGQIVSCHKCGLFALDNSDRLTPVHWQEMFAEKALTEIEIV